MLCAVVLMICIYVAPIWTHHIAVTVCGAWHCTGLCMLHEQHKSWRTFSLDINVLCMDEGAFSCNHCNWSHLCTEWAQWEMSVMREGVKTLGEGVKWGKRGLRWTYWLRFSTLDLGTITIWRRRKAGGGDAPLFCGHCHFYWLSGSWWMSSQVP